jgi:hypothetical protein
VLILLTHGHIVHARIMYTVHCADGKTEHPALVLDTAVIDEAGCVLETVCHQAQLYNFNYSMLIHYHMHAA